MRHHEGVSSYALPLFLLLSSCGGSQTAQPSQSEIHANDSGAPGGALGRHQYICDDGSRPLVDFKDEGHLLEIRKSEKEKPIELRAPTPWLQYQGVEGAATMNGTKLDLTLGERRLSCDMAPKN